MIISAEAVPDQLLIRDAVSSQEKNHGDLLGTSTFVVDKEDELFAFDRTVSRLMEMQSRPYLLKVALLACCHHAYWRRWHKLLFIEFDSALCVGVSPVLSE